MAFFDKLKFWKPEESTQDWMTDLTGESPMGGGPPFPTGIPASTTPAEFGSLTLNPTSPGLEPVSITPSQPAYQLVSPQPLYQQVQGPMNKDFEILSLKLDTIKNMLDTITMRLERLEHITRGEHAFADREIKY